MRFFRTRLARGVEYVNGLLRVERFALLLPLPACIWMDNFKHPQRRLGKVRISTEPFSKRHVSASSLSAQGKIRRQPFSPLKVRDLVACFKQ